MLTITSKLTSAASSTKNNGKEDTITHLKICTFKIKALKIFFYVTKGTVVI